MRYLFVDDHRLQRREGLTRTLHPVRKQPGPVLSPRWLPWEESLANPQVVYDPDEQVYRMWTYTSSARHGLRMGYATSTDGVHWERPSLGLVEIEGRRENNLCDSPGRVGCGVMVCPEMCAVEGADRLFKAMSWIPLDGRQRFVPLYSADGLTWKPPRDLNEEFGILGPGVGDTGAACKSCDTFPLDDPNLPGKYLAFPRLHARVGRFGRRAVGYCYSAARPGQPPCVEWSQPVLAVAPDFRDDEMAEERLAAAGNTIQFSYPEDHHTEFYSMLAFRYEELFLGLLWVFDVSMNMDRLGAWNQHGIISTQLTSSRDLVHWERLGDRQPIIPLGRPGEWDCGMNHFCSYPVPCGDELRIYYAGQSQPHPMQDQARARQVAEEIRTGQRPAGITFGSLRRDGFLSLDAGEAEGFVLTKPLTITGGELHLNVRAAEGGQVVAALCDEKGYPLPGLAASRPVTGDQVDAVVVWEGGCLEALSGQCACLRLTARQAELYAFWFD